MATRLATAADDPWLTTTYNAAVTATNGIRTFWPGGAQEMPQSAITDWRLNNTIRLSFTGANNRRAFITTRPRPIDGEEGNEMWHWIADPAISNASLAAASKELWTAWFTELAAQGVPWAWGMNVPLYPQRTEAIFQNMIAKGLTVVERDLGGVVWRIGKMNPATALQVMARL